jgi:drug/metabolite transporter (DMT)-like permease
VTRATKAHVLLVLVTAVWGATFVMIKRALDDVSPMLFNAVRMSLAAVLLALVYARQLRQTTRSALRAGLTVGIFLWLGYEFQTGGLVHTTPSKSAFLTAVSVVLVPLFLAVIFHRKRIPRWTLIGVGVAFLGLYLLTIPAREGFSGVNVGDILTIGCAVAFAFHIILLGRATAENRFEQIAVLQTATAAALMLLSVPILEAPRVVWSQQLVVAIVVTGALGTAAAFSIQAWAQQFTPPTHTALIFSLEPVFAAITSYLVLGERLGWRGTVGAVLIVAGVLASELKSGSSTPVEESRQALEPAQN